MPNHPHEGEPEKPLDRLAVTAFGDYLASPFHFWARRIRRMDEVDPAKAEMDDFDFGNVCHLVLEQFGTDETARDWTDAEMIEDYLLETADRLALEQWGQAPRARSPHSVRCRQGAPPCSGRCPGART